MLFHGPFCRSNHRSRSTVYTLNFKFEKIEIDVCRAPMRYTVLIYGTRCVEPIVEDACPRSVAPIQSQITVDATPCHAAQHAKSPS